MPTILPMSTKHHRLAHKAQSHLWRGTAQGSRMETNMINQSLIKGNQILSWPVRKQIILFQKFSRIHMLSSVPHVKWIDMAICIFRQARKNGLGIWGDLESGHICTLEQCIIMIKTLQGINTCLDSIVPSMEAIFSWIYRHNRKSQK